MKHSQIVDWDSHLSIYEHFLSLCPILDVFIGRPCCGTWFPDVLNRLSSTLLSCILFSLVCFFLFFLFSFHSFFFFFFCRELSLIVLTLLSAKPLRLKWLRNLEIVIKMVNWSSSKHESPKLWWIGILMNRNILYDRCSLLVLNIYTITLCDKGDKLIANARKVFYECFHVVKSRVSADEWMQWNDSMCN